jgi:hypothetical protein
VVPLEGGFSIPTERGSVHYEAEIAVLIGKPLSTKPSREEVLDAISGFAPALDLTLRDKAISAGDKVVMYFGSANRDPRRINRPEVLDLSRVDNPHNAFGTGPHGCLGQHIARVEIDAMLIEVLSRMTDFAPAGPAEWLPSNFISGPRAMPIRFRKV